MRPWEPHGLEKKFCFFKKKKKKTPDRTTPTVLKFFLWRLDPSHGLMGKQGSSAEKTGKKKSETGRFPQSGEKADRTPPTVLMVFVKKKLLVLVL